MRDNVLKLPQILPGATEECIGVRRSKRMYQRMGVSAYRREPILHRIASGRTVFPLVIETNSFPRRMSEGSLPLSTETRRYSLAASAADPVITEAQLFHCHRVEQIPAVKNYRRMH